MTELILHILNAVLGIGALYYGAEWLVKGSSALARKAGISQLVIGLTFVAFATSAPELVVSVSAAIDGSPGIALGNIVGSNICNIALILGVCACITPLTVNKNLLKFDAPVMCGAAVLLAVFYYCSGGLNRWQGAIFFACIIAYTGWSIHSSRKEAAACEQSESTEKQIKTLPALLLAGAGFLALVIGAKIFIWSAVFLARKMSVSETVIGLTVAAVGTSLPELATSVVAAVKGEKDIAIGNVVGSNIFNILCILGITPLITPLKNTGITAVDMITMLACTILLVPIMRTKWKITRPEGAFYLLLYLAYCIYLAAGHR